MLHFHVHYAHQDQPWLPRTTCLYNKLTELCLLMDWKISSADSFKGRAVCFTSPARNTWPCANRDYLSILFPMWGNLPRGQAAVAALWDTSAAVAEERVCSVCCFSLFPHLCHFLLCPDAFHISSLSSVIYIYGGMAASSSLSQCPARFLFLHTCLLFASLVSTFPPAYQFILCSSVEPPNSREGGKVTVETSSLGCVFYRHPAQERSTVHVQLAVIVIHWL